MRIPFSHFIGVVFLIPILFRVYPFKEVPRSNLTQPTQNFVSPEEDTSRCIGKYILTRPFDFDPVLKCSYLHPAVIAYSIPLFADIDGDGETEVVVMVDMEPNGIIIINPNTCEEEYVIQTDDDVNFKDGGAALGDVDKDGFVDIYLSAGSTIQRWEYNPNINNMEMVWRTPIGVSLAERPHLDILDINQDGIAEIIPNQGQMVDALTGYVYPGVLPRLNGEGKGVYAFTADAIVGNTPPGQGEVELIYGTHIYRYDFNNEEWVLVSEVPNLGWGEFANVSLADMDLDGDVDAVITQWSTIGQSLIWDLQTPDLLGGGVYDYPGALGSRMNIANMDSDPYPEMVMTSKFKIFAIDDIVTTGSFGNIIWLDETSDESGHTQLTSFDFNGDGTYEIVYRDETQLRIFSGLGSGVPTGGYPSGPLILMDSGENSCTSLTGLEYPTIGDIDNDNEAEIIVSCQGGIGIYESASLPWGNASKVWNTQAFVVTNVNQDGTIPARPIENYTIYNNFLAQVNLNPVSDTVFLPLPDAIVEITQVSSNCMDSISLQIEVCNQGVHQFSRGMPLAIYWENPTAQATLTVDTLRLPHGLEPGSCLTLTSPSYYLPTDATSIYAVINDHGNAELPYILESRRMGGPFPITNIRECDYSNNMTSTTLSSAHPVDTSFTVTICSGDIYPFNNQTYSTPGIYTASYTSISGCDSLVTLELRVSESVENIIHQQICSGSFFEFNGRQLNQPGSYRDTTISFETGCDSITILFLEVLPPATSYLNASICEGESFNFLGEQFSQPGIYARSLTTTEGCDSTITLELAVVPPNVATLTQIICEGESYFSGDSTYEATGFYREVHGGSNGCDSIFNLNLIVLPKAETFLSASICPDETYFFNGQLLSNAGTYFDTLQTTRGCDSLLILELSILEEARLNFTALICNRGSFIYNDSIYAAEGIYPHVFTGPNGCDSTVLLRIIKKVPNITYVEHQICEGEIFSIGGTTYSRPGIYEGIIPASDGCDSITRYKLQVYQKYAQTTQITICQGESYYFQGEEHTLPGIYNYAYQSTNGCDSTFTLELSVNPVSSSVKDTTICEGNPIYFDEELLTESGQYFSISPNQYGCDSLSILNLKILDSDPLDAIGGEICSGESIQLFVTGGNGYQWTPAAGLSCTDCPNPIATPFKTTTYTIRSQDCLQMPISTKVVVKVVEYPRIELGNDLNVEIGEEVIIEPNLINYTEGPIKWESQGRVVCADCPTMTIKPERTITYKVTVGNEPNCFHSDEVTIYVKSNCVAEDFVIPNIITPNGDGVNDEFYIEPQIQAELKFLRVYERWGELIFEGRSFDDKWDGTFRGQKLRPAVFAYHVRIKCPDGTIFNKHGNITLID